MAYALFAANSGNRPLGQVQIGAEQNAIGPAAVPLNAWTHLATTYDGADPASVRQRHAGREQAADRRRRGLQRRCCGSGGNSVWGEHFRGLIDEVRIYDRALAAAEIQTDMATPVSPPPVTDAQPPTTPTGLTQTAATETSATVTWTASTDNVAVAGYGLYPGGSTSATTATFGGLTCGAGRLVGVDAYDAAGNRSPQATLTVTAAACDTSPPAVQLTSPAAGPVGGTVTVAATASDDRGVAGVRFRVDGGDLGGEDSERAVPGPVGDDAEPVRQPHPDGRCPRRRRQRHHLGVGAGDGDQHGRQLRQ